MKSCKNSNRVRGNEKNELKRVCVSRWRLHGGGDGLVWKYGKYVMHENISERRHTRG